MFERANKIFIKHKFLSNQFILNTLLLNFFGKTFGKEIRVRAPIYFEIFEERSSFATELGDSFIFISFEFWISSSGAAHIRLRPQI